MGLVMTSDVRLEFYARICELAYCCCSALKEGMYFYKSNIPTVDRLSLAERLTLFFEGMVRGQLSVYLKELLS